MANNIATAKKITVTRPISQGAYLCAQLRQRGFHVEHVPVMEIHPLSEIDHQKKIQSCFLKICEYDGVIFVSLNAAEQALPWLKKFPLKTTTNLFSVGKTTAAYLNQQSVVAGGHSIIFPAEQMDSEGLLALPELYAREVQGKRFLILRGVGGRDLIACTLQERGAKVDICELYRRTLPQNNKALQEVMLTCDLFVVNSVESLENLLVLVGAELKDHLQEKTVLVPGERVAAAARHTGFRHIITAPNATDAAVIEAIGRWAVVT